MISRGRSNPSATTKPTSLSASVMTRASFTAFGTMFALMYLLLPTTSATRSCARAAHDDAVITAAVSRMTRKPIERFMMRFLANQNSIAHNDAGSATSPAMGPTDCICLINSGPAGAFCIGLSCRGQPGRPYMRYFPQRPREFTAWRQQDQKRSYGLQDCFG